MTLYSSCYVWVCEHTLDFLHTLQKLSNVGMAFFSQHIQCECKIHCCVVPLLKLLRKQSVLSACEVFNSVHRPHVYLVSPSLHAVQLVCRSSHVGSSCPQFFFFMNLQTKTMSWNQLKAAKCWICILNEIGSTNKSSTMLENSWFGVNVQNIARCRITFRGFFFLSVWVYSK